MIILNLLVQAQAAINGKKSCVVLASPDVRITQYPNKEYENTVVLTEKEHLDTAKISLGSFISIGTGCKFMLSGNHDWKRVTTFLRFDSTEKNRDSKGILSNGDIVIGNDVWIGNDCTFMSGITIGHGAVIASGSTVTKDVEPYSIVGGMPAKLIKKRFDDNTVDRLLKSEWWNIPREELIKKSDLLFSRNINDFLDSIEP
jgi:acetyltransferase-like isoleucine patch superfamily enzyme